MDAGEGTDARTRDALERVRLVLHTLVATPDETDAPTLVLTQAVAGCGATTGALLRIGAQGALEVAAAVGLGPHDLARYAGGLVPGTPVAHAAVLREPVLLSSRAEHEERFPALAGTAGPQGASATLPLVVGARLVGLLLLGWADERRPDRDGAAFLTTVADLAGLALRAGADAPPPRAPSGPPVPSPAHPADVTVPAPGQEVRALLRALFEEAPIGLALLDPDLRFAMVNPALAAVNGVPVEDHLGRHLTDVLPDIGDDAVAVLRRVLETGEPLRDVEITGRTPASPHLRTWVEDFHRVRSPSGEVLGVVAVLSDVTAQRRSERRLRQLIDSLFSFVGLCLPDGTLVEANRTAVEAGGLTMADVVGRKLWETSWFTWDDDVVQRAHASVLAGQRGRTSRFELEVRMAHGTILIDYQLVPVVEDGAVVALVPSATDITARRRSVDQATALAVLARRLNAAATVAEVGDAIGVHASAAVGSRFATVGLADPDGGTLSLLQPPDLPEELRLRYRALPLSSPLDVVRAVREQRTVVLSDPVRPRDVGGDAGVAAQVQADRAAAGVTLSVATPLLDAAGRAFGALTMGWASTDSLDDELTARVETVAELCAQAFERARLTDAHVVAAQRTGALAELAQELASAVTAADVACAVGRLAPAVVGASRARLRILEGEQPVRPESAALSALGATDLAAAHRPASVVLVLRDSTDSPLGTLELGWDVPVVLDPVLRATLDTVTELCGQTVERARLHAAEHELVEGLQRRFLRPMPEVDGLEMHATYRAAQTSVGIGGDFYDGLVLPDGRLAVVLGDVAGHGMEAAADMAQLRTVLSTLLAAGVPLERVFDRAEQVTGQVATVSLATAVVAVVDVTAGTLTYTHAGHPPLVLRGPDGATAPLEGARGPLLGVSGLVDRSGQPSRGAPVTVPFPPGSALVGYTDGLVEDRLATLDDGITALVGAAAAVVLTGPDGRWAPGSADRVAEAVLARCIGERALADDVALLVLTRPPV
ncbi:SpoIIE family protein phosphatase [Kineosporia sp. A_224]|uniref:SpoIIE family protein phosphatase n=1 Tax=Kineosporia sp. A_224 TaxID=1962180 RepID=UPI000B4AAD6A|nr:SpoIIE family protein phosphatase [Kineosporia sp. A_224]